MIDVMNDIAKAGRPVGGAMVSKVPAFLVMLLVLCSRHCEHFLLVPECSKCNREDYVDASTWLLKLDPFVSLARPQKHDLPTEPARPLKPVLLAKPERPLSIKCLLG
jgi:hypothetical protein